ncbi:MAG: restriction endonuclease subunit S [Bacteroidetes bacterium]|nr:restriction endonuclease subunit S [Bacteroidota bacterium]
MNKVKLGDICVEVGKYGIPASAVNYSEDLHRYLRITDISDDGCLLENDKKSLNEKDADKYLLSKNDIVFARTGASTGRSFFYEEKFGKLIYAGFLIKFKLDESLVNPKFIKYYTISPKYKKWIENYQDGSTRGNMNANTFANMELELPNRKQQDLAVSILSSIDDKIELNNKINKELENLARTIYEYWFVQNAEEKWERKSLKDLGVEVIRGVTYNKNDIKTVNDKNVIGILRATNINGNVIDLDNLVYVNKSLISENQKLQLFDIMVTMSSGSKEHIGKNGLFCFDNANVALGAFCSKIDVEKKYKFYLYKYFQSEQFKNYVKNCCLGTNINNLNNEIIKDIVVIIPPTELLDKFNKTVSPLFSAIIKNRQENATLAHLRDFLLPLLMNGQVTVNKAQDEPTIIPLKTGTDDDMKYQTWKEQIGLAARGGIDEQTLRNIYEAIDEK